jgi:hypothetical protein
VSKAQNNLHDHLQDWLEATSRDDDDRRKRSANCRKDARFRTGMPLVGLVAILKGYSHANVIAKTSQNR